MTPFIKNLARRARWWRTWHEAFKQTLAESRGRRVLEIGPGRMKREAVTTMDVNARTEPDLVHDANVLPWPVATGSFDYVFMMSVLEHLRDPLAVLEECHRVLSPGGIAVVLVPHFSSSGSFIDPTHVTRLSARSVDYLVPGTELHEDYSFYSDVRFRIRERLVTLHEPFDRFPGLQHAVNAGVATWETHLCYVLRGAAIYWELERLPAPADT